MLLLGFSVMSLNLAGCGFTLAPPGFVREHRHGVVRAWFDHNSLNRPSLTFERYDRLPPDSARVKLFRWSHGGSVDKPLEIVFAEPAIPAESLTEATGSSSSQPCGASAGETGERDSSNGNGNLVPPLPLAPPSEIEEPRFPDDRAPYSPFKEISLSRESGEMLSDPPPFIESIPENQSSKTSLGGLVSLGFSEDLDEPVDRDFEDSSNCHVPRLDTWKMLPE
jgi:hypothetical protein